MNRTLLVLAICSLGLNSGQQAALATDSPKAEKDSIVTSGNISTTISTNINELGNLLDFKKYKPTKVKFCYWRADNSGSNERLSVSGPSDYRLDAALYFDSLTFNKILAFEKNVDFKACHFDKALFNFDFLDTVTRAELLKSDSIYPAHHDVFFGTRHGKSWYLHQKILITCNSFNEPD